VEADRERLKAVREVLGYDKGYQIMNVAIQVRFLGGGAGRKGSTDRNRFGACPRPLST
jgi:hypothetical protein